MAGLVGVAFAHVEHDQVGLLPLPGADAGVEIGGQHAKRACDRIQPHDIAVARRRERPATQRFG